MLFRLGLFFYFMFGIYKTYTISRQNIKFFVIKIGVLGTLYFLAYPIMVFINIFVNDYVKHKVISIGGIIIQTLSLVYLSYSVTSKYSHFYKVSLKSKSLLPNEKET